MRQRIRDCCEKVSSVAGPFIVRLSERAESDFTGILHYHNERFGRHGAEKINEAVLKAVMEITKMTGSNPIYNPEIDRFTLVKKNYRIIFNLLPNERVIAKDGITWRGADPGLIIQYLEQE